MKKKVAAFSVLAVIVIGVAIFLLAKIPSPQTDHKIFGSRFEEKICDKYELHFVDEAFRYADRAGYDSNTLELTVHGDPKIYDYQGRDIYCRITADYKGETLTFKFKGTKIVGTKYEWSLINEEVVDVFKG